MYKATWKKDDEEPTQVFVLDFVNFYLSDRMFENQVQAVISSKFGWISVVPIHEITIDKEELK